MSKFEANGIYLNKSAEFQRGEYKRLSRALTTVAGANGVVIRGGGYG